MAICTQKCEQKSLKINNRVGGWGGGVGMKMSWVEKNRKINNRGGGGEIFRDSRVTILRWFEYNSVQLISNYVGNGLGDPARCWD